VKVNKTTEKKKKPVKGNYQWDLIRNTLPDFRLLLQCRWDLCFFWNVMQHKSEVCYWSVETTYRSHLQGSSSPRSLMDCHKYRQTKKL